MHHHISNEEIGQTSGRTMPLLARFYDGIMTVVTLGREKRFRNKALDLAQIAKGESVLDVGCGTGTLAIMAKARAGDSGEVCGIDATPQMIERARRKANSKNLDLRFAEGLIEDLSFPDESFDLVLNTLMMHHLPLELKQRGLKEIMRVLKPGGRLLVIDFGGSGRSLGTLIHGQQAKRIGDGLARLLEEAGFGGLESGKAGGMGGTIYVKGIKPEASFDPLAGMSATPSTIS